MEGTLADMHMFGGNFAPRNWALSNGGLLPISDNSALFAILGTTWGGDGRVTFALPDLRGRVPTGTLQGPGLSDRRPGNQWGTETTSLAVSQLAAHSHEIAVASGAAPQLSVQVKASSTADSKSPQDAYWGTETAGIPAPPSAFNFYNSSSDITMASDAVEVNLSGLSGALVATTTGSSAPFLISQPSIAVPMIICISGVFPSRN